jgi:hypothetical protein
VDRLALERNDDAGIRFIPWRACTRVGGFVPYDVCKPHEAKATQRYIPLWRARHPPDRWLAVRAVVPCRPSAM